ncbi:AHA1 family protein [Sporobolomyces koalae]|uniref:AHA1 family protein n=1 Tax=Sporobolomyces koalae TaxID=500713 RepID=UPI0031800F79
MSNLSHGIKHWHWRTKGVEPWAKQWFTDNLVGTEAKGVTISAVTDVEGDCELGMRKSKLITVYDQKVSMTWTAKSSEGDEISGTLIALEVAHDMDEDEYRFEASISSGSGKEADAFYLTAKRALADKLRPKFQQFPKDMVETHGKDLLDAAAEAASSAENSGANTPEKASAKATASSSSAAAKSTAPSLSSLSLSTAVVRATGEFQADAATLWDFLTNPQKVQMWTRNPARMAAEVGAEMELFGGNIKGKVQTVEVPKKLVTSWRAPTWPENHYGTLETALEQGSNSTTLNLKLSGVPIGKEDETEQNLQTFYIRGLQAIGLGLSSVSTSVASATETPSPSLVAPSRRSPRLRPKGQLKSPRLNRWTFANVGTFLASAGLILGMGAAFYYGPSGPGSKK